jgi:hypothetical protein
MATFPNIEKYTITPGRERPIRKTQFASGAGRTAPKYTTGKRKFSLNYSYLKSSEVEILDQFFEDNQGTEFLFLYTKDSNLYTVRFDMEEISFPQQGPIYHSCQIQLKEA